MNLPSLHPDDLPPSSWTEQDATLRRKLGEAVSRYFYESCDGVTQAMLLNCEWHFAITARALTLVINCADEAVNQRLKNYVVAIANRLKPFSKRATILICPRDGETQEIRVDEISVS
ncbi:MAG: hypothetical protein HC936_10470 [Leptolyngbyaceae cyanobacterium SU_3_3]|nr:hypothetical protein [Leptolyngbyaceae cyanobacterium SU_3_3]NJR49128.1 hypothetical protein [Leptolyngbyaceae cyanobacterium CSU_1_3]